VTEAKGPRRPLILGTAGHIDHGKTLLIKMLTGVDTDRLVEEKRRGISIELGFASLTTPSGHCLGVVDVPGHERFVKTMLAGAAGIDLILFVIAADEGIMPQTREHLEIMDLLGIHHGVVALTKVDLVDEEWLELVIEEVRAYLKETPLAGAPIVPVSSVTGQGKEALLQAIDDLVPRVEVVERGRSPRLPVDRVFVMEGFGTVVTGTLWAGRFREGDQVRILPQGIASRIKALEVHKQRVSEAVAGQRTAVALHAVDRSQIRRGDWVTTRTDLEAVRMIDGRVRCLPSAPKPLPNGVRIRFHLGAAEILGRLILLEADELAPGQEGWAQIRLEKPTLAERGDRFVLRTYSPARTVAGGTVVLAENRRRRRFRAEDLEVLKVAERGTPEERILHRLGQAGARGLALEELCRQLGQPRSEIQRPLEGLVARGEVVALPRDHYVLDEALREAGRRLQGVLEDFQRRQPLRWGMSKSELKSRLGQEIHPDVVEEWVRRETADGRLHARKDLLRWGRPELELAPPLRELRERILGTLRERGFAGPTSKELTAEVSDAVDPRVAGQVGEMLALLLEEEQIVRIPPDILLLRKALEEVPVRVREFFASGNEQMTVPQFKDILGVTRKQAVPLLEYLDRERYTVRRGDVRVPGPRLRAE
jgi:selenocysteine-specific elongation factor